jgi:hypothetical protein
MRVTAESTANSGTPKVNNVCFIINYSQCDISHLSRAEFADIIVDTWVGRSTQWVGILEAHGKDSSHLHTAKNCPQDRCGELSESLRIENVAFN